MNKSNSLEITKGMFDAVEKTHRALLEECAESIKNLFENKKAVFVEFHFCDYKHKILGKDSSYTIWIESLHTHKYFDTWLEMVEWIARFEILMRRF